MKISFADH
jgi:hypothetical protein